MAVYFTENSAGLRRRVDYLVNLRKTTEINAVVLDVKDYSGNIPYPTALPAARQYGAVRPFIRDIDGLVDRLHAEGIYVIARITCFQDPVLAQARPELAVHRLSKLPKDRKATLRRDSLWLDRKGLSWLDPASRAAWDYLVAVGRDALAHGVDELNFDYIRFPSDGDLNDMYFPDWDGKTPKSEVIRGFFAHLRKQFAGVPISADVFGLATVSTDDLGIGQVIEDAYASFDYVCPMVYPSHYARQFLGFRSPAAHPYQVVSYSVKDALSRLNNFRRRPQREESGGNGGSASPQPQAAPPRETAPRKAAKLRPWIQDFNLGARYNTAMVRAEIRAIQDALGEDFAGYMVWSPSNVYKREALRPPPPQPPQAKTEPTRPTEPPRPTVPPQAPAATGAEKKPAP